MQHVNTGFINLNINLKLPISFLFIFGHTFIVLSLDPEAKNGPFKAAVEDPILALELLIVEFSPALVEVASLIAAVADSGAQAIHSTTWSCSRKSALHSLVCVAQILTD